MEELDSQNRVFFDKAKPRDFGCPCGKSYLSYAALFTHIKQKHDGKAPGQISKPSSMHSKRGRPPTRSKQGESQSNQQQVSYQKEENIQKSQLRPQTQQEKCQQRIQKSLEDTYNLLEKIASSKIENKMQLNEIEAFTEMTVIVRKQQQKQKSPNGVMLGEGVIQFLKDVSQRVAWDKFEQLYILMMIFLQYIIDEENTKIVLKQARMDLLCRHVNEFCENHMMPMAEYYCVNDISIFQGDVHLGLLSNLFQWMDASGYSQYKVRVLAESNKDIITGAGNLPTSETSLQ